MSGAHRREVVGGSIEADPPRRGAHRREVVGGSIEADPPRRGAQCVELSGELTIHTAGERKAVLGEALDAAQAVGATVLELDLAGVAELDTAGVQLLLLAQREAAGLGCQLRLAAMSEAVRDVLAIAHLGADLDERLARAMDHRTSEAEENVP